MRKLSVWIFLFVAIVGFGGILRPVHADTLTPAEAASALATLESLKAKLADLQAQAAAQASAEMSAPAIPVPTIAVRISPLSAQETQLLSGALSSLSGTLTSLQAQLSQNPQLALENAPVILAALQGMGKTIASIDAIAGGMAAAPAVKIAPQPAVANLAPAPQSGGEVTAQAPGVQITSVIPDANTAQVSSVWSRAKGAWQYILVGLIVIAGIVFWFRRPGVEEDRKISRKNMSTASAKIAQASQSNLSATPGKPAAPPILHS